jgi:hypothetical protein
MKPLSVLAGSMWVVTLLLGLTMWVQSATITYGVSREHTDTTTVSLPAQGDEVEPGDQFAEPRLDLYGNEVSDAVGDYRVDPRGYLYERHAPDTAVLKLGPPGA